MGGYVDDEYECSCDPGSLICLCSSHGGGSIQTLVKAQAVAANPDLAALSYAVNMNPGNEFVIGCNNHYKKYGKLSDKQRAALYRVRPENKRAFYTYGDNEEFFDKFAPYMYDGDDFGYDQFEHH